MRKIKHAREIRVAVLAIVALFLLYFGFNYLKGVNLFSATTAYTGEWEEIKGLTEQAPVYVKGYKVGQVDKIAYDFTREQSFHVTLSVNRDIVLPAGTEAALIADGLLGGTAVQLNIPTGDNTPYYKAGDLLPTTVVPGLVEELQQGLLANLSVTVQHLDSLVEDVQSQLEGDHIKNTLAHVDNLTEDLNVSSRQLKGMMQNDVPQVVADAKDAVADIRVLAGNIRDVDLAATVSRVDETVDEVKQVVAQINSQEGTLGMLLHDKELYVNIDKTVVSADSLLTDLKANPKRYVHFSLFGGKKEKNASGK